MAMQYSLTYNSYNNWTLPLNLAIGFHILVAVSIVVVPDLLKPRPKFEDIYTVDLINVTETIAQPPQDAAPPPEPVEPVENQEAIALADPVKPVEPPKPVKPVSIKPLKRKVKKKIPPKDDPEKLKQLQRKRIAEALKAEQEAARQAQIAAEEAARQQKLLEQQVADLTKQTQRARQPATRTGSSTLTGLERQYYSAIAGKIAEFWSLPEYKNWDPSTQAIVVIRLAPSGRIMKQYFEEKSNDPTFDQFVRKTLQDASPLPPFPPALRKKSWEIGLRFRPEGIQ
jgi:colicin import membrane protein